MPLAGYMIDAAPLVLLVVGRVGTELIEKHRRLRGFDERAYHLLEDLLAPPIRIHATPNVLTETSNLLRQHADPERGLLVAGLRTLVEDCDELIVESMRAVTTDEYALLGLTDATILEASSEQVPILNTDSLLYGAALDRGQADAVNFVHLMMQD